MLSADAVAIVAPVAGLYADYDGGGGGGPDDGDAAGGDDAGDDVDVADEGGIAVDANDKRYENRYA